MENVIVKRLPACLMESIQPFACSFALHFFEQAERLVAKNCAKIEAMAKLLVRKKRLERQDIVDLIEA